MTSPLQQALLALSGLILIVATALDTPVVAVFSLPAALLAPGYVALRAAGRRRAFDADPWLTWSLRVVFSLAVWTVLGAVFAVAPLLDPRWVPVVVGCWLLLLVLAELDRTELPNSWLFTVPWPRFRREAVMFGVFVAVAAGSVAGAYAISTGAAAPAPYLSASLTPATSTVYDRSGRLRVAVRVDNASTSGRHPVLTVRIDGRQVLGRTLSVPAGGSVQVALTQARTPHCWTRLTVAITGVPARLQPRDLTAYGPATQAKACTPS